MALILLLETAGKVCSVGISENGVCIALREDFDGFKHAEKLFEFIDAVLHETGKQKNDLDAVAVSAGPGSYTGLRIGVSAAKGFCMALDIPLIAIETLVSLTLAYRRISGDIINLACPMLDARRMEVYSAVFDASMAPILAPAAIVVDESTFEPFLTDHSVAFFGDGAEKCQHLYEDSSTAKFVSGILLSALDMASIAEQRYHTKQFELLSSFEPDYLKAFYTTMKVIPE